MFYPPEEFEAQVREYLAQGMNPVQAYTQVLENEERDAKEYHQWLEDEEAAARLEEDYRANELNDAWYDDQYEVDTADF